MKVALIQSSPKLSRANLAEVLMLVEEYKDADVVVFPELSLSGYLLQDKLYEDAWKIEELSDLAHASMQCDIIIGAALWDNNNVYNSALYFSQGALLHIHHKNHLPTYGMFEEGRYFTAGDEIASFSTPHGNAIMVICEDVWRAESIAAITASDAEVVYVLAASPARDFSDEGISIESQWDALLKSTALLSHNYVVFVNRVGFEDGLGFWGGSRVISPMGKTEYTLSLFESEHKVCSLDARLKKLGRYLVKHT